MKFKLVLIAVALGAGLVSPASATIKMGEMSYGGQFRSRYQITDPVSFPNKSGSDDKLLLRTRVWSRVNFPEQKLVAFVEIQDSRTSGSEASVASNEKNIDAHQVYLDILSLFGAPLDLRVGRQELKYGDQRLVSTLDWHIVGRAWDGARLQWTLNERFKTDLFYTIIDEIGDAFDDQKFSGLYANFKQGALKALDGYIFARQSGDSNLSASVGGTSNLDQYTAGTLAKGKVDRFDFSGEVAFQFGKNSGQDIKAHAWAATAGVSFPERTMKPRVGVGYDFASGDSNPNDNDVETFDPLFPFGHYYQGHADVFSWKNGHDMHAHLSFHPIKKLKTIVSYHNFKLAEDKDAWYGASGAALAQDSTGAAGDDIGQEIDIHFKTTFRDVVKLWFGYAHFMGGDFGDTLKLEDSKDFAFFQATLPFGK